MFRGFRNRRFLWLLMRGLLKNKKILHLGAWKRRDFSQWVKGHFKIVVSKSCKKSALYISERFFKKVFDWGLKKYWFSYRYIRCKIFFKIRVYETAKKWRIDERIKIFGCQNSKNSSLYNGEEEFIRIMVLKI